MILADFESLLKETMGLDPATVGSSTIESAVRKRMERLGLKTAAEYWKTVRSSEFELQELIESVVVPETWFFRDREAFTVLARFASQEWLPKHPNTVLRLLSGPCCSGEEPYSMAMALVDSGLPPEWFQIDAIDISKRSLGRARRATYGPNSFRGEDLTFRDRYLKPTANGYLLAGPIRDTVTFHHGNLLANDFRVASTLYDVIFCRNLLIYFDRDTQRSAMRTLDRMLAPSGLLFVGPSESFLATCSGFKSIDQSMSFAFRKVGAAVTQGVTAPRMPFPKSSASLHTNRGRRPSKAIHLSPAPAPLVPGKALDLDTARRWADAGRLREAEELCELHLKTVGPSSQAYYLLGLVHDAAGDLHGAADCYRKVLYLEPMHREALLHLALLSEKRGDTEMGQRLRDRARRVSKEKEIDHAF